MALRARDEGLNGVVGQILLSPALCHPDLHPSSSYDWKSLEGNKTAPILTRDSLLGFWGKYLFGVEHVFDTKKWSLLSHLMLTFFFS